jgi:hypothetical protein
LIVGAATAVEAAPTRLHEAWQTTVTNDNAYSNAFDFDEIELTATFVAPSGRTLEWFGVYDGDGMGGQAGNVWRLTFLPDEVGTWHYDYAWSDGTPGGSGLIGVVGSTNRGLLRIADDSPFHLKYQNGERMFWTGDTEWPFLSDIFTQAERFDAIDFLADHHINNLLMCLLDDQGIDVVPWEGTRSVHDKNRYQLSRWHLWDDVIRYMNERGIVADLWFYSDDSSWLYPDAFSKQEDQYFKYIVGRYGAMPNVTWNLALEYDEYRTDEWAEHYAEYVSDVDTFDHLLAVHQLQGDFPFPGNPHFDHTALQSFKSQFTLNQLVLAARQQVIDAGRPIPIMMEEFCIEGHLGTQNVLTGIWAVMAGGAMYKHASLGWKWGVPYQEAEHFDYVKAAHEFITQLPYWEMEPSNDLVSSGFCLADPGSEYFVWAPDGTSITLDLSDVSGGAFLHAEWFDPRLGTYTPIDPVEGGGPVVFDPPTSDGWALHVGGDPGILAAETPDPVRPGRVALVENPVTRGTLAFELSLHAPTEVRGVLVDVTGRIVRRLFNGESLASGVHPVRVDLDGVADGVYFYRMSGHGWREQGRVVVE